MKRRRGKKPMLAFSVLEEDERTGDIVYVRARNRAEAMQKALSRADCDIVEAREYRDDPTVVVSRTPFADRFAPGPCPHWAMVANGWNFDTERGRIDADAMHDMGLPIRGIIGAGSSMTFACAADRDAFLKRRAHEHKLGELALKALEAQLLRRLPNARPLAANDEKVYGGRRYTYVTRNADGFYHVEEAELPFDFDGRQYGYATIGYRRPSRRWRSHAERAGSDDKREYEDVSEGTPNAPRIMCSNGDVDAFNAWCAAQGYNSGLEARKL